MGATNFSDVGRGRTIANAFANAVKEAQYEYGHDPYSGTIATKGLDGYVEFPRPPRVTAEKVYDLVWKASDHLNDLEWAKEGGRPKPTKGRNETDEQFKARKARDRKWARESKAAYERLAKLYDAATLKALLDLATGSKWGPCVAIQKSKNQWLFFGMAPC